MAISSDPKVRRAATSKGHIRGVAFVDDRAGDINHVHVSSNDDAEDVDVIEDDELWNQKSLWPQISDKEWIELQMNNAREQATKARSESAYSLAVALVSIVLNVVILAKHFAH